MKIDPATADRLLLQLYQREEQFVRRYPDTDEEPSWQVCRINMMILRLLEGRRIK